MKKLLLIMLIGVLSSGCQIIDRGPLWQTESNIDDELLPYYEAFLDEREKLGFVEELPHINIIFGELAEYPLARGACNVQGRADNTSIHITSRTVIIKRNDYENVMKQDGEGYHKGIEMLMFHELAHCFWRVKHFDKEYPRTVKIAEDVYEEVICRDLMHHTSSSYKGTKDYLCYTQHFDLYQEQLRAIMSNKIIR